MSEAPMHRSRVLVVDDDQALARTLAELLVEDGHDTDIAADGTIALDMLGAHGYDVILSDMKMPRLDGPGLYHELERQRPELAGRMVFITGNVVADDTRDFLETTGAPVIRKPFRLEELHDVIDRMLERVTPAV